ncbi:hypothetical protein E4U31_007361 [Claviceps sp. LM219 group G6]|nr:hypothetical protein E4U31_007361 [Claviceps sp. LM219 group G6]
MAHQGRPVRGAEVGESVSRGGRDLHSSHQNTENQNEIASLPQRSITTGIPKKIQLIRGRNSGSWCSSWKLWEQNEDGRAEERDRRVPETSQQSAIPNLKEIIEGAVAKVLSKTPTTASSWAAIAARVFNAESYYKAVHHKFGHIAAFCAPPREMWPLLR